jgi:predicted DNA-binding WGR domain protein
LATIEIILPFTNELHCTEPKGVHAQMWVNDRYQESVDGHRFKLCVGRPTENANNVRMEQEANNLQMLVLERRDPDRNMARFYVLAVEPTLLADSALVREWGRIGTLGRRRLDLHPDAASAGEALEIWLARKTRRGYRIAVSTEV